MDERENLLEELRSTAKPLIDTCDTDIAQNIDAAVQEAWNAWNDTRENLLELRTKYQRAVALWQQYREASAAVRVWADEQMGTIGTLQPSDAIKQVQVRQLFLSSEFRFYFHVISKVILISILKKEFVSVSYRLNAKINIFYLVFPSRRQ